MDCLRSFNFSLFGQANMVPANGFKTWVLGAQHYWLLQYNPLDSTYNIQGFKNINIYKIEVSGDINSDLLPVGFSCLVQNWNFEFQVIGQNSTSVGNITVSPNGFSMVDMPLNPLFNLSKFQRSIEFSSPIQSAKNIVVNALYADGIANESLLGAQIEFQLAVTVHYKYEGE
jgi:hypothetical protein